LVLVKIYAGQLGWPGKCQKIRI